MVYLVKMVIFHGYCMLNNQMVHAVSISCHDAATLCVDELHHSCAEYHQVVMFQFQQFNALVSQYLTILVFKHQHISSL